MAILKPTTLDRQLSAQTQVLIGEDCLRNEVIPQHRQLSERARALLVQHADGGLSRTRWVPLLGQEAPALPRYALRVFGPEETGLEVDPVVDIVARKECKHSLQPGEVLVAEETLARLGGVVLFSSNGAKIKDTGVTTQSGEDVPRAADVRGSLTDVAETLDAIEAALQQPTLLVE